MCVCVCRREPKCVRCMCDHGCVCGCEVCECVRRLWVSVSRTVYLTVCIGVGDVCECVTGVCFDTHVVCRGKCECASLLRVLCVKRGNVCK